jgi:hypothetical protein
VSEAFPPPTGLRGLLSMPDRTAGLTVAVQDAQGVSQPSVKNWPYRVLTRLSAGEAVNGSVECWLVERRGPSAVGASVLALQDLHRRK